MDLAHFMGFPRIIKDTFGEGGFSRIDMGHDADVSCPAEG
jgi:hypothetical protein